MEETRLQQDVEKLAAASVSQLRLRFQSYTGLEAPEEMFNQHFFETYLRYINHVSSGHSSALLKPTHRLGRLNPGEEDFFGRTTKNAEVTYEQMFDNKETISQRLFVFYPRAILITQDIEQDVKRGKSILRKIGEEIFRMNVRYRESHPEKYERGHVFSTEKEYFAALRDPTMREIMLKYAPSDNLYLIFRCDMSNSPLRRKVSTSKESTTKKSKGGWFEKWAVEKNIAVLIVPSISSEDLERLILKEKRDLGILSPN